MTIEAANAFLKTLEEPSPTTNFILTSDRPNYLLPTILSRCQKVRFNHLPDSAVARALVDGHGQERERAGLLAELSGGSLGKALEMLDEGLLDERDTAWSIFSLAAGGKYLQLLDAIGQAAEERGRPERVLNFLSIIVSDLLHLELTGRVRNADKLDEYKKIIRNITQDELQRMVTNIEHARIALSRNVNPRQCLLAACTISEGDGDDAIIG